MKCFLPIIITMVVFSGCNRISKNDLTVIEGLHLGVDKEQFLKQFDSLDLSKTTLYSKCFFNEDDRPSLEQITFYTTDIFNYPKYRNKSMEHIGLLYPVLYTGTNKIIGVQVMLIHTEGAIQFTSNGVHDLTVETKIMAAGQDIPSGLTEKVGDLLEKKYGNPSDTIKSSFNTFLVIDGKDIREFHGDENNCGTELIWKTKYFNVTYFSGIRSNYTTYNSIYAKHNYYQRLTDDPYEIDYKNGEETCRQYCLITYMLNDETIKKLGLDDSRL